VVNFGEVVVVIKEEIMLKNLSFLAPHLALSLMLIIPTGPVQPAQRGEQGGNVEFSRKNPLAGQAVNLNGLEPFAYKPFRLYTRVVYRAPNTGELR
jgi:hypothetical protein